MTTPAAGPATPTLAEVIDLLDLVPEGMTGAGADRFEARHSDAARATGHVFGGLIAAQSLVAAARTVGGDRPIHSLHGYFLRRGDARERLHLEVSRSRDGRSFSHRHVAAIQAGRPIAEFSMSFATPRPGLAHQVPAPAADGPAGVRPDHEVLAELPEPIGPYGTSPDAFELRTVGLGPGWFRRHAPVGEPTMVWKRADGEVPADPVLHAALFTYASDMRILHPVTRPHGLAMYGTDVHPSSVDHAVWFHRPVDVRRWTLWRCESPWAADGRAFTRATVYDEGGALVASVAQEGLIVVP